MELLGFLILFPVVIAAILLFVKAEGARKAIVYGAAVVIAVASIALFAMYLSAGTVRFAFSSEIVDYACIAISVLIAVCILYFALKYKNMLAAVLAIVQVVGSLVFEFGFAHGVHVSESLYVDGLSLIMTLIIGIVGSGICVYALGYMEDFQAHEPEESPDRRPIFFALMFLFLGAMYVIVFSNNMSWLFTGWEITTLCSFLLISYTRTEEAIANAFLQIIMNLIGGIAFLIALYISAIYIGTLRLDEFIALGVVQPELLAVPVTALAFAGLTKAAQMPFHTWLLGAMVAPTPTSALLHSSTMVKAGVFLLLKLAPVLMVCVVPQTMVTIVGGVSFLLCSFMAISQTNAKRVLAYSTIANLGLITACAGVGTPEAIWAGVFLIIFHAVAKSLLFICVGTAEHHIGSRDIEEMDLLFERMPRLARFMMLGIMCMFIAPFGMLVSKWAALVSFIESPQALFLVLILAFGSAATFMFWAKWIGKLSGIAGDRENIETTVHKSEWTAIGLMAALIVLCCLGIPFISTYVVHPYVTDAFAVYSLFASYILETYNDFISFDNLWLASLCCLIVVIILFAGLGRAKPKQVGVYLAGSSVDNENRIYRSSMSGEIEATSRNMYLDSIFGEAKLSPFGSVFAGAVELLCFVLAVLVMTGIL